MSTIVVTKNTAKWCLQFKSKFVKPTVTDIRQTCIRQKYKYTWSIIHTKENFKIQKELFLRRQREYLFRNRNVTAETAKSTWKPHRDISWKSSEMTGLPDRNVFLSETYMQDNVLFFFSNPVNILRTFGCGVYAWYNLIRLL